MSHNRTARRAYTTIEVLIAMTVFAIGAAGVMSMQRAAIQGNFDARRMDVANGLAREWVERLRRDALLWTTTADLTSATGPRFINTYATSAWVIPTVLCPASGNGDGLCPGFDLLGRDLNTADVKTAVQFCTQIRLTPLVAGSMLRAEVRVFWLQQISSTPAVGASGFCDPTYLTTNAANLNKIFHFVYADSAVRMSSP